MHPRTTAALLTACALIAAGCGDDQADTESASSEEAPRGETFVVTTPAKPTATPDPNPGRKLTAADTEDPWPFTVDTVYVRCESDIYLVVRIDGEDYALNGTAQSEYPEFDRFWKKDPYVPGAKVNISELIDIGQAECGS